tara:strand:- start:1934 stop:2683 length:750 start_codon:yes stop_codon:yes gene_type:complete
MNSNKDKKIKNNTRSRINVNQNKVSNSKNTQRNINQKNISQRNSAKNNSPSISLGINVEKSESQREILEKMQNNLKRNNEKVKKFQGKVTELRKFNNKLSEGYQLSLKMVVDVSDLLQRYVGIFEMLENLMTNIESTFEFNDQDFRYIRDLTEKSIEDIRIKMNKQVDSMVVVFEKEGLTKQASELKKLKETSAEISVNASNLSRTTQVTKNAKNAVRSSNSSKRNVAKNTKNTKPKTFRERLSEVLYS